MDTKLDKINNEIFKAKNDIVNILNIYQNQFIISYSNCSIDVIKYSKLKCKIIKTILTKNYVYKNLILLNKEALIIAAICSMNDNYYQNNINVLDVKKSNFLIHNNIKNKFISDDESFLVIKNLNLTKKFVTGDINGNVFVWDYNNKNYFLYEKYDNIHNDMVKDIIEIDKNIFASIALDNKLIIYNYIKKRNSIIELNGMSHSLFLYSPKLLFVSSFDFCVYIYDVNENKITFKISGLFSVPKNFFLNLNGSVTSLRFNGKVDIFGIFDINEFEFEGYKNEIIKFDLKEAKKHNDY